MKALCWVAAAMALAVTGCGGGGGDDEGETLTVSFTYPAQAVYLYESPTVMPLIDGLKGHTPSCALVAGMMPAGLQLRGDCAIVGRATAAALNVITVRLSASGVSNTLDFPVTVQVNAPEVEYPDNFLSPRIAHGATVSYDSQVRFWNAGADVIATWTYSIHSGQLPIGLSLDPATGRISGTAQERGIFNLRIKATLQTQFGTYLVPSFPYFSLEVI